MNIINQPDTLSDQLQLLKTQLAKKGFQLAHTNPTLRGERQYRYTIRRSATGVYVAYFCWYVLPATERPYNSRPRQECVYNAIAPDLRLLERLSVWYALRTLRHAHPVRTPT